jgi:N-methylhydantoinase B
VIANFHGIDAKTRQFFIAGMGPLGGGWGAKQSEDGVSATVCINDGDTHNSPNEQTESKFPLVVECCKLIPDSAGAGLRRGGLGVESVVRARADMVFSTQIDRIMCKPWGLSGGGEAAGNEVGVRVDGAWTDAFPNGKINIDRLKVGDAIRMRSGGGGGYGAAFERSVEQVQHDVRQGYVSAAAAAALYGVVIDPETFEIDHAATERRRAVLARG